MDDVSLLLRYSETFELPPGVAFPELLAAFERASNTGLPAVSVIADVTIGGTPARPLRAEVVTPPTPGPHPIAVYLHGGGWTTGTPEGYRRISCELAARGMLVVTPDYRRAPRHRFPAALHDAREALEWALARGPRLGGDPERLVVAGDSAGANLAAATLVTEACAATVRAALLFYGIFDYYQALPVIGPVIGGPTAVEQLYLPVEDFDRLRSDPRVSPILATELLPRTFVAVGSKDPLAPQSFALRQRLDEASGRDMFRHYPGAPHGFLQLPFTDAFSRGYDDAVEFAQASFDGIAVK